MVSHNSLPVKHSQSHSDQLNENQNVNLWSAFSTKFSLAPDVCMPCRKASLNLYSSNAIILKCVPDVTFKSFPIASFHTRPRTLGGSPFHHRSCVFFAVLLHSTVNKMHHNITRTLKHFFPSSNFQNRLLMMSPQATCRMPSDWANSWLHLLCKLSGASSQTENSYYKRLCYRRENVRCSKSVEMLSYCCMNNANRFHVSLRSSFCKATFSSATCIVCICIMTTGSTIAQQECSGPCHIYIYNTDGSTQDCSHRCN